MSDQIKGHAPALISPQRQGQILRSVMHHVGITREEMSKRLLVSKRTMDAWLLPPESKGFRLMRNYHFEWVHRMLQHHVLMEKLPDGSISPDLAPLRFDLPSAGDPLPNFDLIQFPSVYRSEIKGKPSFSFIPGGRPILHLEPVDPADRWLVITMHEKPKTMEHYVKGLLRYSPSWVQDSYQACKFEGSIFSMILLPKPGDPDEYDRITCYSVNLIGVGGKSPDDICITADGEVLRTDEDLVLLKAASEGDQGASQ